MAQQLRLPRLQDRNSHHAANKQIEHLIHNRRGADELRGPFRRIHNRKLLAKLGLGTGKRLLKQKARSPSQPNHSIKPHHAENLNHTPTPPKLTLIYPQSPPGLTSNVSYPTHSISTTGVNPSCRAPKFSHTVYVPRAPPTYQPNQHQDITINNNTDVVVNVNGHSAPVTTVYHSSSSDNDDGCCLGCLCAICFCGFRTVM